MLLYTSDQLCCPHGSRGCKGEPVFLNLFNPQKHIDSSWFTQATPSNDKKAGSRRIKLISTLEFIICFILALLFNLAGNRLPAVF